MLFGQEIARLIRTYDVTSRISCFFVRNLASCERKKTVIYEYTDVTLTHIGVATNASRNGKIAKRRHYP